MVDRSAADTWVYLKMSIRKVFGFLKMCFHKNVPLQKVNDLRADVKCESDAI